MRFLLIALMATACTSGDPADPQGNEPSSTSSSVTMPGTTPLTEPIDLEADLELVQQLIAGEQSAEDVIPDVSWGAGFPLSDGESTWFVHWYEGGDWALAGDFNDWEPTPMQQGNGFWYLEVEGEIAAGSGYKFVNGGSDWVPDPWARSYRYDTYGELSFVSPPSDGYHLERFRGLEGQGLAPRDVVVYVPAGEGPFDVMYAHDGQNLFDPNAIWGGWRMDEALREVGDILVVGVANTPDRMNEYVHVDDFVLGYAFEAKGDDYAALVHEDLRPFVERTYPTSGHDGLIGSSLGGLISLHIAWTYPGEYDFVASMSGTLGWGRFEYSNPTMEERWLSSLPADITVYVDSGGSAGPDGLCTDPNGDGFPVDDPDSADNYCETRQFADAMAANGLVWDDTLFHWHEPDAPHQENAWAARVHLPLQRFLEAR